MVDHLRPGVCFWHSFAWAGRGHVRRRHARPAVARPAPTRWTPPARRWPSRSSSSRSSARRTTASTTATSPPSGARFAEFRANLDALVDDAAGYQERTGVRLLWGTANLFTHPRYQAGAATNPDPEVFAYAAAQVKHMLEVTQRLGGENYVLWGGREGYDTLLNTDLRREGDQLARFLHLVVEHKHKIGFTGQLLIEPKPMEPTKHQYDYDVATVHGFLVRNGLEGEYRVNIEANHATLAGHSFHHEVAYAAANGMLGSIDANRGDPQNGWDTDQFPNSVEDLVAAAVRDPARAAASRPAGSTSTPSCAARAPTGRDLFHAHIGGIDTLARALLVAADLVERGELARAQGRRATPAGTASSARRSSTASLSPRRPRGQGRGRRDRPAAARRAARSGSRTSSTRRSGRSTGPGRPDRWASSSGSTSRPRRPRRSSSTRPARSLAIGSSEYGFEQPQPLWSEQDPQLWWAGAIEAIGRALAARRRRRRPTSRRVGLTGQMHGLVLLDAAGEVLRPAILWNDQRTAAECDAIRETVGQERLVAITGNDALTGFTAPKLVWVRDHEPDVWAPRRPRAAPQGLRPLPADRRLRDGQGRRRRDDPVRPRGPRLVAGDARRARDRPGVDAADVRGPAGDGRRRPPTAAAATGLRAGTPVMAGGGDQAANAVGVGAVVPGRVALSLGHVGRGVRDDRPAAVRARGPRPRVLPRRARPLAHDVGDALGGRQPALVPRRGRAGRRVRRPRRGGRRGHRRGATGSCSCRTCRASAARTRIRWRAAPSSGSPSPTTGAT